MKKSFLILIVFLLISLNAFAASNKAHAIVQGIKTDALGQAIVVYKLSYTKAFDLDGIELVVNLNQTPGSMNNAIQTDAMNRINEEIGTGTITDKNNVRLIGGFVS